MSVGTLSEYVSENSTCPSRMQNSSKESLNNSYLNHHQHPHQYQQHQQHRKRSFKERYMQSHVIVLLILVFGLSSAVAYLSFLYVSERELYTCNSEECIRSALNLLVSMDDNADPCTDFYQFACGSWPLNHPIPDYASETDWFNDRKDNLLISIKEFLNQNGSESDPFPVQQARVLYRSCLTDAAANDIGIEPVLEVLNQTHLPLLVPTKETTKGFNWVRTAVRSKMTFDKDFFVAFNIAQDINNRTINRLSVSKPTGDSPLPLHRDFEKMYQISIRDLKRKLQDQPALDESNEDITGSGSFSSADEDVNSDEINSNVYVSYLYTVIKKFHSMQNAEFYPDQFPRTLLERFVNFTSEVEKLLEKTYSNSTSLEPTHITIVELQNLTDTISNNANIAPIINWREYFSLIFEGSNVTLNFADEEHLLLISNIEYITDVFTLLAKTDSHTMELYMWWEVVSMLIPYTTVEFRHIHADFTFELTGHRNRETRTLVCADIVNQLMGMAVSYSLIDDFSLNTTKLKVADMVTNIHWAFRQIVGKVDWMDEPTKVATLKKAKAMKTFIGYPEMLLNKTELESYYEGIEVYEDQFLRNILTKLQTMLKNTLDVYREPYNFDDEDSWATDPTDVNAFHWSQANAITIPAGILQFPFYGHGLEALNYGAIGSILGHEITHGFDDTGKKFDDHGNKKIWWTNNTVREYKERTKCFIDHYSRYRFPELNETVDGMLTLDENIADNGGLRESLLAYRRYVLLNGVESKLPGLEKYSHEQLLYLSFANTWCENSNPKSLYYSIRDAHSPNKVRVQEVLRNSYEFAQVWKCPKGSAMNPVTEKCQIW